MQIYDRLYGEFSCAHDDERLFQTPELTRLRQVSLSAVPTWLTPTGVCASKFEHTIAVGHLARIVGTIPAFQDIARDLYFAALAHDVGTPPFSHISEHLLRRLLKRNHEEFVEEVIDGSEFAQEIVRQGGSLDRLLRFVTGKEPPYSDLLNGSIDIDNLDNTLRYGYSMGILRSASLPYLPEWLAGSYRLHDGRLALDGSASSGVSQWAACRKVVYRYVHSPPNIVGGMMLYRALDFAARAEEIPKSYFTMTDGEAYRYLLEQCNSRTQVLVQRAMRWQFYALTFNDWTRAPSAKLREFTENIETRSSLADALSAEFEIPPEDICVYCGKDRGWKRIDLCLLSPDADLPAPVAPLEPTWMIQVYVHPAHASSNDAIRARVTEVVEHLS